MKLSPWLQAHIITLNFGNTYIVAQRGDAALGERLADCVAFVAAGVVETLVLFGLMFQERPGGSLLLAIGWVGEGVVALHLACSAHLLAVVQAAQTRLWLVATPV